MVQKDINVTLPGKYVLPITTAALAVCLIGCSLLAARHVVVGGDFIDAWLAGFSIATLT